MARSRHKLNYLLYIRYQIVSLVRTPKHPPCIATFVMKISTTFVLCTTFMLCVNAKPPARGPAGTPTVKIIDDRANIRRATTTTSSNGSGPSGGSCSGTCHRRMCPSGTSYLGDCGDSGLKCCS
ncbi:hypothetical protein BDQ12DRAFT_80069 [Crucibulum laeve]|uniref:Uncharacterized protein n=1 Tax=Crucibulum laeve TaxID=68775 RepID=A0A5C3LGM4_9AGAR|nr:hypothetical protein BDQ12DRAFT_80069 [Crucibulum laeve]